MKVRYLIIIQRALRATVLLPADVFPLPAGESPERKKLMEVYEEKKKKVEERREDTARLAARLEQLDKATEELTRAFDANIIARQKEIAETNGRPNGSINTPPTGEGETTASARSGGSSPRGPMDGETTPRVQPAILAAEAVRSLSDQTKSILNQLGVPNDYVDVPRTVTAIEDEMEKVAAELYVPESVTSTVRIGNTDIPASAFFPIIKPDVNSPLIPGLPYTVLNLQNITSYISVPC